MKPGEEDTQAHELVLIRRRGGGEDAPHKGGVWKIAYADFMTAMMAFFLVMWLINSTDQKVLTQVANYFNPMRLTDATPHTRGVQNVESGELGKQGKESAAGDTKEKRKAKEKARDRAEGKAAAEKGEGREGNQASTASTARFTEQALFSDPYGVLARIAAEAPGDRRPPNPASKDGGAAGSELYRDPFDPAARRDVPEKRIAAPQAPPESETKKTAPAVAGDEAKAPREKAVVPRETALPVEKAKEQAVAEDTLKAAKQAAAHKAAAQDEAARIEDEIKRAMSQLRGTIPNIDVTITDDGVLISLTDDYDFGMFAIASAEPRPALVVIMEKMAKILQAHPQPLIVRGHTDGRPYRSGTYDNWRLSTARAHMAYYMLVRGGIDDKRFERVEGYADRSLRVPDDPAAAENRRIEILLRRPKP